MIQGMIMYVCNVQISLNIKQFLHYLLFVKKNIGMHFTIRNKKEKVYKLSTLSIFSGAEILHRWDTVLY